MGQFLLMLAVVMPQPIKLCIYRRWFNWKIGRGTWIGFSYIEAQRVIIGNNVRINHLNIWRKINRLEIGDNTYIANGNEFFGNRYPQPEWTRTLLIGEGVLIMSHHFIDVAATVTIDQGTTLAGRDTQLWSHSLLDVDNVPQLVPVDLHIGKKVYLGARSTVLFCRIPDGAVVGAGSVVTKSFEAEGKRLLIAGNPAVIKKFYDANISS